jgi:hypothetical protein
MATTTGVVNFEMHLTFNCEATLLPVEVKQDAWRRGVPIAEYQDALWKAVRPNPTVEIMWDRDQLTRAQVGLALRLLHMRQITLERFILALPPEERPPASRTGISDTDFAPLFSGIFWRPN